MPIDVPVLSAILASGAIGYGARWFQDRRSWNRLRRSEDLTFVEEWLHNLTAYLRGQSWLIEDFVDMQRQLAGQKEFRSGDSELREQHHENIVSHGTALDNSGVRMVQLAGHYTELKKPIDDLNRLRRVIEQEFMKPAVEYYESLDQLDESAPKSEVDKFHMRYGKPLGTGVTVSRAAFAELWPKISDVHDQVWQLKNR